MDRCTKSSHGGCCNCGLDIMKHTNYSLLINGKICDEYISHQASLENILETLEILSEKFENLCEKVKENSEELVNLRNIVEYLNDRIY